MEKVLRSKRLIVETVLSESPTDAQLFQALTQISEEPEAEFLSPIIMDYLRLRREELLFSELLPAERRQRTEALESKYVSLLKTLLSERKEMEEMSLSAGERVFKVVENFLLNHSLAREEKIYLHNQSKILREKVYETEKIEYMVIYLSIETISRIETLRKESQVLQYQEEALLPAETEKKQKTPLFVQKLDHLSHPVRITGRASQEDIRNMLKPKNGPEMTVEEYGNRILQEMKEQGISIPASAPNLPSEEGKDSEEEEEEEKEEEKKRKREEKEEEIFYGEGNRLGRK